MGKNVITPHFPNTRAYTDTRSPQGELGYTFCNLYEVQPLKKKKRCSIKNEHILLVRLQLHQGSWQTQVHF